MILSHLGKCLYIVVDGWITLYWRNKLPNNILLVIIVFHTFRSVWKFQDTPWTIHISMRFFMCCQNCCLSTVRKLILSYMVQPGIGSVCIHMYYRERYVTLDRELQSWRLHWSLCGNGACCMASSPLMKYVLCIMFHIVCRKTHVFQSSVGSVGILMDSLWKDSCILRPFLKLQHGARGKRNHQI